MKWTMGLWLVAAAGCGYGQTKMAACPPTGCANQYAATSPESLPASTPPSDTPSSMPSDTSSMPASAPSSSQSAMPASESDLPPERTPAVDALPNTQLQPLPDRAMPPPIVPPNL
jgi:hypothetical protein